jgi:hypothetical protein
VDLAQERAARGGTGVDPEHDHEHVSVIFLEPGPLAERVGVLERQRAQADQLGQSVDLILFGAGQVNPDEVAALDFKLDLVVVRVGQARHPQRVPARWRRITGTHGAEATSPRRRSLALPGLASWGGAVH